MSTEFAWDSLPDVAEPSYVADYEASLAEEQSAKPTEPPTPLPPRLLTPLEWVNDVAPEEIVAMLLYFASTHLLTGASKGGKTWFMLQLVMAIVRGLPISRAEDPAGARAAHLAGTKRRDASLAHGRARV